MEATISGAIVDASEDDCTDLSRRRNLLQAGSAALDFSVTVSGADAATATTTSIAATVIPALDDGSFATALSDAATTQGVMDFVAPTVSDAVVVFAPTATPTEAPRPAPPAADDEDATGRQTGWQTGSLSVLASNAVFIVGFSVHMKRKVGTSVTNGNIVAISLGWIDQISDMLFGVELVAFTPEGGEIVQIIGVVALVWFVGTAVYNHVMWQRIMKVNQYDKALVGEHAELYGALNIFVLGSLDLMTIFPWTDPNVMRTHSYPSKAAVRASINSAMLEDLPQLLFNVAYFALIPNEFGVFPVVNCCVTMLTLLWTVFTKRMIVNSFDVFDTPTSEAEGAQRDGPTAAASLPALSDAVAEATAPATAAEAPSLEVLEDDVASSPEDEAWASTEDVSDGDAWTQHTFFEWINRSTDFLAGPPADGGS